LHRGSLRQPDAPRRKGTRLIYDAASRRFVFSGVRPGTVAHELGLRNGDVLESVNGTIIDDLDSGLSAFAANENATVLRLRISRSDQWIDFTVTFA
jgi:hypothetical protein